MERYPLKNNYSRNGKSLHLSACLSVCHLSFVSLFVFVVSRPWMQICFRPTDSLTGSLVVEEQSRTTERSRIKLLNWFTVIFFTRYWNKRKNILVHKYRCLNRQKYCSWTVLNRTLVTTAEEVWRLFSIEIQISFSMGLPFPCRG